MNGVTVVLMRKQKTVILEPFSWAESSCSHEGSEAHEYASHDSTENSYNEK